MSSIEESLQKQINELMNTVKQLQFNLETEMKELKADYYKDQFQMNKILTDHSESLRTLESESRNQSSYIDDMYYSMDKIKGVLREKGIMEQTGWTTPKPWKEKKNE
ncbi:hypothetical protein TVAGG3_0145060 [Trichomonas vaginalis G3]|uniref:hypothetical protein n=1 Tax=Trichomonas vaginalis (strain ATCC PRA-98 / G3) TaxID=412133 RepID=UPI0021E5DB8A|nr:hypothetical protein TVAGG3_0145060 [Trichomonas vaginalis G3]KAI5546859.1 hypothetical protein TVAGG3_0145060 [Trichomonas vaginalis G3]